MFFLFKLENRNLDFQIVSKYDYFRFIPHLVLFIVQQIKDSFERLDVRAITLYI